MPASPALMLTVPITTPGLLKMWLLTTELKFAWVHCAQSELSLLPPLFWAFWTPGLQQILLHHSASFPVLRQTLALVPDE